MAEYREGPKDSAGSKEAKLEEIQKKIDELIKERERIKSDAVQQEE